MTSNQNPWLDSISLNGSLSSPTDTSWLLIDDKSVEYINKVAQSVLYDDQSTYSDSSSTILEEIDEWIKEEPFSDWLEEKIDVPIFEDFSFNQQAQQQFQQNENLKHLNIQDTQYLLEEFETVLEEACQQQLLFSSPSSTLTPPQSPPGPTLLQPHLKPTIGPYIGEENQFIPTSSQWNAENVSLIPLGDEGVNVVDELLNPYPTNTSEGENQEEEEEEEEESDSTHDEDPDWNIDANEEVTKSSKKHRYQPYPRASSSFSQDKKIRKKEQNKNAATRYRQKKKQEVKEIIGEEQELKERNETLKSRVLDLQREIGYLKGLMKDLFKAKGLVK